MKKLFGSIATTALCAASALLFMQSTANAQDSAAESQQVLDVITVTARKRAERIIDIPIAVTAFDAREIESLGLESILDLPAVTPGFVYEEFSGIPGRFDNSPRFRGISVNSLAPSRQTASIFVDGIFVSNGIQGIGLDDVERIEIIKGPQSAYFGRLTFGGAVNYITKTPGSELSGKISAMAAEYNDYSLQASIEGPIMGEVVKGRLSAAYADAAGQFRAATSGDRLGQERTSSLGGTLYITPNDDLEIKLRAHYYENDDGAPAYSFAGLNDHNCGPFGGPAADTSICGVAPLNPPDLNVAVPGNIQTFLTDGRLIALNGSNLTEIGLERESTRLSAQFDYTFPGTDITLSGLFGFNDEEVRLLRDADDSADLAFLSWSGRKFEDDSQELRLSGNSFDDRLRWSVGANVFNQEFMSSGNFIVPSFGDFAFGMGEPDLEDIQTVGYFGSLAFDITDDISVSIEGRQQEDEVLDDGDITDTVAGTLVKFDNFLPRAIVEWSPTDDSLLYLTYSEGNLPGGFNAEVAGLTPAQLAELLTIQSGASATFEEEKLANYELGWKQNLPNGRGVVTLAVFHMDRTNQTFRRADIVNDPTSTTGFQQVDYFINAGESSVDGFEFEGDFVISDSFQISTTLAHVDSGFDIFNSGVHNELFGTEDAGGRSAERFPKWSGSVSGIFGGEMATGNFDWFARADVFYTGERFADEGNLTKADAGTQLNLRAGVENERYRIEAFVKNATDDDTPTAINRFRDLSFATPLFDFSTLGYQIGLRDKRQFGVRASLRF